jgi:hypothetical protein
LQPIDTAEHCVMFWGRFFKMNDIQEKKSLFYRRMYHLSGYLRHSESNYCVDRNKSLLISNLSIGDITIYDWEERWGEEYGDPKSVYGVIVELNGDKIYSSARNVNGGNILADLNKYPIEFLIDTFWKCLCCELVSKSILKQERVDYINNYNKL